MFKFASRLTGFVSVMLVIVFCIFAALGIAAEAVAEGINVLVKAGAGITGATSIIMLLFASRDSEMQESLRRMLALSLSFGFMAFVIWPTELNPSASLPSLVLGAAIVAFMTMLITPRTDLPGTLEGRYAVCMGIPLIAAVLAWKIGLGPLWDAHPVVGGLAAFSVTTIALGIVYGLQGRVPEFPVREVTA